MYNRYVRNDTGVYRRIPTEENHPPPHTHTTPQSKPNENHHSSDTRPWDSASLLGGLFGKGGLLSGILEKLNLSELDTGDLLLLVILFLLFRDGGDEELLIALGLLLIL